MRYDTNVRLYNTYFMIVQNVRTIWEKRQDDFLVVYEKTVLLRKISQ
jgi:hypothetical protein